MEVGSLITNFKLYIWDYMIDKKRDQLISVFLEKNKQINLSAIRDVDGVYYKHILDALEIENIFSLQPGMDVCDV